MFSLMKLPYEFDDYAPTLSTTTLELHYTRHHQGYVRQLNDLVLRHQEYSGLSLEETAKNSYHQNHRTIFNNSAQIIAHDLYWKSLTPISERRLLKPGPLRDHLEQSFGTLESMMEQLISKGLTQFGSGWVWLVYNKYENILEIVATSNAHLPWIENHKKYPLHTIDVWEHAYYVDYYNQRKNYLENIVHYLNWNFAEDQYINA